MKCPSKLMINLVQLKSFSYKGFIAPARSPWSNKYDPPLSDGAVPSDRLRRLEIEANQAFDTYREL